VNSKYFVVAGRKDTIIYSTGSAIHRLLISDGIDQVLPVGQLQNIASIDYDYLNSCVYWADTQLDSIQVGAPVTMATRGDDFLCCDKNK
jgi:hypothetical protein